jgi:hypothetical protein
MGKLVQKSYNILTLVMVLVASISGLIYIGVVGPRGFYIGAFGQKLAVKI